MAKIKINSALMTRMKKVTEMAGYSSVEEFVTHIIENELAKHETKNTDEETAKIMVHIDYPVVYSGFAGFGVGMDA